VTRLRKLMLDELQRRNYAQNTVRAYVHAIEDFARYFHRSPDRLGPNHIREYQVHLFRDCKLSAGTIEGRTAALRFLFVKTLRRPYLPDHIPFPKRQRRMPTVLSQEEVTRLIASARFVDHGFPNAFCFENKFNGHADHTMACASFRYVVRRLLTSGTAFPTATAKPARRMTGRSGRSSPT
jgi:integrase